IEKKNCTAADCGAQAQHHLETPYRPVEGRADRCQVVRFEGESWVISGCDSRTQGCKVTTGVSACPNCVLAAENGKQVRIDTTTRCFCCVPVSLMTRTEGGRFARPLVGYMNCLVLLMGAHVLLSDKCLLDWFSRLNMRCGRSDWCRGCPLNR